MRKPALRHIMSQRHLYKDGIKVGEEVVRYNNRNIHLLLRDIAICQMAPVNTLRAGETPDIGTAADFHVNNKRRGQHGFGRALYDAALTNLAAKANVILYNDGVKVGDADVVRIGTSLLGILCFKETPDVLQGMEVNLVYEESRGLWGAGQELGQEDGQELDPVEVAPQEVNLDGSQPVTTIRVQMPPPHAEIVGQFNHTHTVRDLHAFVRTAEPSLADRAHRLMVGPSILIAPPSATLEAAELLDATLTLELRYTDHNIHPLLRDIALVPRMSCTRTESKLATTHTTTQGLAANQGVTRKSDNVPRSAIQAHSQFQLDQQRLRALICPSKIIAVNKELRYIGYSQLILGSVTFYMRNASH
ncbi:NSFL1 cofactor p47 [Ditylenchus destructor]|nr:NSFL1 cofactor p47 [Ditylenchus destructor]